MEASTRIELQDKQSNLFMYAFNKGIDIYEFINCFMKSNLAKELDKEFSNRQLEPISSWYEELDNQYKFKNKRIDINKESIIWLGYFYRKWHFLTAESSSKINSYLNSVKGIQSHYNLHQIDERYAIKQIKEDYNKNRNKNRKYDSKFLKFDSSFFNNDNTYFAFLAKKILHKLFNSKDIDSMIYRQNNNCHYFINKKETNKLIVDVINKNSKTKLLEIFSKYKYKDISTMLFIFVFSKEKTKIINQIEKIRDINKYKEVFICDLNNVFHINESNEINQYNIAISYKLRESARKEMELNKLYLDIEKNL